MLTQGGGVFGTFVSSFYLQFSRDGRQWHTYKELVTDARPRAKVRPQAEAVHLEVISSDLADESVPLYPPLRFFTETKTTEGCQRVDWTGWWRLSLSVFCRTTSRMASTSDWRSWAVETVSSLVVSGHHFTCRCNSKNSFPLLQVPAG